jgi:hypothetical protein
MTGTARIQVLALVLLLGLSAPLEAQYRRTSRFVSRPGETEAEWADGARRVTVHATGRITFSDAGTDVAQLSPGGHLVIEEVSGAVTRRFVAVPSRSGGVVRKLALQGQPVAMDTAAHAWLASILPEIRENARLDQASAERFRRAAEPSPGLQDTEGTLAQQARALVSDGDKVRLLGDALAQRGGVDIPEALDWLAAATTLMSDEAKASLLVESIPHLPDGPVVDRAFADAAATLVSADAFRDVSAAYLRSRAGR